MLKVIIIHFSYLLKFTLLLDSRKRLQSSGRGRSWPTHFITYYTFNQSTLFVLYVMVGVFFLDLGISRGHSHAPRVQRRSSALMTHRKSDYDWSESELTNQIGQLTPRNEPWCFWVVHTSTKWFTSCNFDYVQLDLLKWRTKQKRPTDASHQPTGEKIGSWTNTP